LGITSKRKFRAVIEGPIAEFIPHKPVPWWRRWWSSVVYWHAHKRRMKAFRKAFKKQTAQ
jgi:hypothetical protein